MRTRRSSVNSLRFKLLTGMVGLLAPLIVLLLVYNYNATSIVTKQVTESNQSIIDQYMMQVDTRLAIIKGYLYSIVTSNQDIKNLEAPISNLNRMLSTSNLSRMMSHDILTFNQLDYMFLFNPEKDIFVYDYREFGSRYAERTAVKDYILGQIEADQDIETFITPSQWYPVMIEDEAYIIFLMKSDQTYAGAWIKLTNLLAPLADLELGVDGQLVFEQTQGQQLTGTAVQADQIITVDAFNYFYPDHDRLVRIDSESSVGSFTLVALISQQKILDNLPYFQTIILVATLLSVLLIPIIVYFIRLIVIRPIDRTITAMTKVMNGNIDVRIKPGRTSEEFIVLSEVFNNMLDQIYELKENFYEEQLERKQAELEHLQLQIRPHFFLNSLNMIYRQAQNKQTEFVQGMTKGLISHFQYIFNNNSRFVRLGEELDHMKNYMRIQEYRYADNYTYSIQSPDFLKDTPVPPLLIQSFVENSFKHAVAIDQPIMIEVGTDFVKQGDVQYIEIKISDNGSGFPQAYLGALSDGNISKDRHWQHIGIWNAYRRLQLIYLDQAQLVLSNKLPHGAVVTIRLPIRPPRKTGLINLIRGEDI